MKRALLRGGVFANKFDDNNSAKVVFVRPMDLHKSLVIKDKKVKAILSPDKTCSVWSIMLEDTNDSDIVRRIPLNSCYNRIAEAIGMNQKTHYIKNILDNQGLELVVIFDKLENYGDEPPVLQFRTDNYDMSYFPESVRMSMIRYLLAAYYDTNQSVEEYAEEAMWISKYLSSQNVAFLPKLDKLSEYEHRLWQFTWPEDWSRRF